jgi:transcriptional regulator NrdR family protein
MAKHVIKRGGKLEPFRAEKLKKSIRKACKDARIVGVRAKKAVANVSGPVLRFAAKRKTVRVSVLRQKVLAGLKKAEPTAAKAWVRYDKRRRAKKR